MPVPSITALPTAPSRTSPSTFASLADAWVAALATFTTQMNDAVAAINAFSFPSHRRAVTGTDTAGTGDNGAILDCSGSFTLSITAAATLAAGWWCIVANRGTGNITLDPNASETVDGQTTGVVYPGFAFMLHCDGSTFRLFKMDGYRREVLTGGTTWTCPVGIRSIRATAQGGGASGRKAVNKGTGGGGGGCAIKTFDVTPGTAYTYAVGGGGSAVSANSTNGNAGSDTTLTVGATTITGGGAPAVTTGDAQGAVSAGGSATNGDANIAGGWGVLNANSASGPSFGGDSQFGRGGVSNSAGANAATGYGSGGGGGTDSSHNSGAGLAGVLILEY